MYGPWRLESAAFRIILRRPREPRGPCPWRLGPRHRQRGGRTVLSRLSLRACCLLT